MVLEKTLESPLDCKEIQPVRSKGDQSWVFFVKTLPAMQETLVQFLGIELGRSTAEGIGYPLQNSWSSLVAQLVKNLPAMPETWVQFLGWDDPLEKGMATHSGLENSMWTSAHGVTGVAKSQT